MIFLLTFAKGVRILHLVANMTGDKPHHPPPAKDDIPFLAAAK
jgi:hypothetical protein